MLLFELFFDSFEFYCKVVVSISLCCDIELFSVVLYDLE